MKITFPKLDENLFKDEKFKKSDLNTIWGGVRTEVVTHHTYLTYEDGKTDGMIDTRIDEVDY